MLRPAAERAALLARISKQYNIGNLSTLLHFLDVERFWSNNSYIQNYNATNLTMQPIIPRAADTTVDACEPLLDVLDFFHLYYIPFIICMGILGNVLSCIVFLSTHLKMRSSSYYLAALATADLSFLASLFMVWLSNNVGVQLFNKNGWCQFVVYVSSVSSFLSVWLIVAFTVERFIAVQYPLHRPHMCTVARAKMIITFLTIFALLLHLYSFVTAGVTSAYGVDTCDMLHEYHETMRVINIIDSIFTLIVPLFLIVIMNTMITRNLFRFSRHFKSETSVFEDSGEHVSNSIPLTTNARRFQGSQQSLHSCKSNHSRILINGRASPFTCDTLMVSRGGNCSTAGRTSPRNVVSARTQQSITKMLLLISTVFVLLNLPSYVIRLYVFVCYSLWETSPPPILWCMQQFFMLLYYTHFSINFLLYSMCGITFRRCLAQLLRSKLKALAPSRCLPQQLL